MNKVYKISAEAHPVLIINCNAQFSKTGHATAGDEIEHITVWHPSSVS